MRGRSTTRGRTARGRSGRNEGRGRSSKPPRQVKKAEMSPLEGVELLYPTANGRKSNLLQVKKAFSTKMQTEHGLHALFLDVPEVDPAEDEIPEIVYDANDFAAARDPGHIYRKSIENAVQERARTIRERKNTRYKIWASIKSICSTESWSKIETWDGFDEANRNRSEISGARLLLQEI